MAPSASAPVFVLTTSPDPLMHSVLAVARSLGRWGVPVFVAHPGGRLPVDASRYVAGRIEIEPGGRGGVPLVDQLVDAAGTVGTRPVLVPVDDWAALTVDANDERLAEHYRFPRRPAGTATRLASKAGLTEVCRDLGVPTPLTWFPSSEEDLKSCVSRFPVVVKAVDPLMLRRAPGARSVTIAADERQLRGAYDLLAAGGQGNVMVQEYVPGGANAIWMLNGYFDAASRCRFAATGVKLRQCPPGTGPTTLGEIRANRTVQQAAERLLSSLGYTGIVDLGFRYDARDGVYKLLDVNPRIGGTFRLFTGQRGLDVVRSLYLDMTRQPVPEDTARDGRRWQDEPHDLLAQGIYRRRGESSWPAYLASLRGVDERAWYAADDLRPFALMCRHTLARTRRGLGLLAGRPQASRRGRAVPVVAGADARPDSAVAQC